MEVIDSHQEMRSLLLHQVKKGSMFGLISTAGLELPESGYYSKLDTSPKLFTTGT